MGVVRGLQPGDPLLIGPYRLVGQLGHGGMGRVFLGLSAGGRPVAVKIIRAELAADPDFRARFGQEVAAARKVSGLFTAMVVAAEVDGPVSWLATAYVPGPSLAEAVNDHGPLPTGSLLTLAAGLTESLCAIHAAGVVHRDLKPSNVLLAEDGPRVIDFGISRAAETTGVTQTGLVIGSPGFMSPEQAQGHEIGPPSDVFSLGAVLAFAATGQGPFGTGTTPAMLYRVVHGSPSLDRVPPDVRPLVERCLAKDPRQRPTADGLLAEVGALLAAKWLPESIIRAFARDNASGPALATPGAASRYHSPATLTTTAAAVAQVSTGDSRAPGRPGGQLAERHRGEPAAASRGGASPASAGRQEPAAAPLAAATGAGVGHRLSSRGIRRRWFRRERFRRAHARPDPVRGGSTELLADAGAVRACRADDPRPVCLAVSVPERVPRRDRIVVRTSAGERISVPVRAYILVAQRVREHIRIPVRVSVGLYVGTRVDVATRVFVPAYVHAGEHRRVRIGIRVFVVAASLTGRFRVPTRRPRRCRRRGWRGGKLAHTARPRLNAPEAQPSGVCQAEEARVGRWRSWT